MLSKVTRYNYGILLHIPICSIADELYDIEVILRGLWWLFWSRRRLEQTDGRGALELSMLRWLSGLGWAWKREREKYKLSIHTKSELGEEREKTHAHQNQRRRERHWVGWECRACARRTSAAAIDCGPNHHPSELSWSNRGQSPRNRKSKKAMIMKLVHIQCTTHIQIM